MKLVDFIIVTLSILFACLGLALLIEFFFYNRTGILICSAVSGGLAAGTAIAELCIYLKTRQKPALDICFILFLIGLGSTVFGASFSMMW